MIDSESPDNGSYATNTTDTRSAGGARARRTRRARNQAGRPTQTELERRKRVVVEVATELFIENGYAGTSLVEIAKRAGVATRTVYQHFGGKEDLFQEVIFAREFNPLSDQPVVTCEDTLFGALMAFARYACDLAMRDRSVGLMRLIIAETKRFPDLTKKVADATLHVLLRDTSTMFEALAERGAIPDADHRETASLFIDLVLGIAPLRFYAGWESHPPTDKDLSTKVELFILGRFGPEVADNARSGHL